jgi:hypothetical protein
VGAILARSLAFSVRHLPVLALLSGVLVLPLLLFQFHFVERLNRDPGPSGVAALALLLLAFYFLLPLLLQVFVTLAVFQHLRGERASLLRSILRGLLSLLPALGMALLFLLVMFGALLVTAIPMGMITSVLEEAEASVAGLVNGLVSLLVMSWLFCLYFVAPQALVVERLFPWTALGRSLALTRGSRWRIFAILVLLVVVLWAVGLAVTVVLPTEGDSWVDWRLSTGIHLGLMALVAAFAAVCAAVTYHDLRGLKDGVNVEDLIRVFE